jgi:hypothetical protein
MRSGCDSSLIPPECDPQVYHKLPNGADDATILSNAGQIATHSLYLLHLVPA